MKAQLLQSVANSLRDLKILDRAATPQDQALEIRRQELGDAHPETLESFLAAARLFIEQSKYTEADAHLRLAIETARNELGDEHRFTLLAINRLGINLHAQGRYAESAECMSEVLEIRRRVLGEEEAVQKTGGNLAFALDKMGKHAQAEALYREVLQLRRRVLGNKNAGTLWASSHLGTCLHRQGKLEEAEPYLREALEGYRNIQGDEHDRTVWAMHNLGKLLRDMDQLEESERLYAEAVAKGRHTWPDERPQAGAYFLLDHARTLTVMKRFEQAEDQLLEALAMYEDTSVPITHPPHFEEFTNDLAAAGADLYDAWHTAEPDAGYDAKAAEWRAKLPDTEPDSASP